MRLGARRKGWSEGDVARAERNAKGDCYVVAFKLAAELAEVMDSRDIRIVHGWVDGRGPTEGLRFVHAWVELKNQIVIDRSNGLDLAISVEAYYAIGGIVEEEIRRYTVREAEKIADEIGWVGCWEWDSSVRVLGG